jgi:pimeloyl-ACP methyl ester carboxylesterase
MAGSWSGRDVERMVRIDDLTELWVEERGDPTGTAVLLIMGANASGMAWPEELVDRLADRHRVIRYDHRDTGRSSRVFDQQPYAIRDLAGDCIAVLDALGVARAHVVGMSMGGVLVQLLLLDHPDRLLSATVFATAALGVGLAAPDGTGPAELPGPAPELLEYWGSMGEERDLAAELDWRVEHWRRLNGHGVPFDPAEFRDLEERAISHAGDARSPVAHALADQSGLDRGPELAANRVPTLVVEAPEDPINPPPHAANLAAVIGTARMLTVPGMGHALPSALVGRFAELIAEHAARTDAQRSGGP